MPSLPDDGSEDASTATDASQHWTQNDFFKVLEADMDKVQEFTRTQVVAIRDALRAVDAQVASLKSNGEVPIGAKEQVDAIGERFLKLEKVVSPCPGRGYGNTLFWP